VVKFVNNRQSKSESEKSAVSFIFSLKNRVGGLARALRVFEVSI
jgi:prephenate dehydratase